MEQKEQKQIYVGQIFDPRINADAEYWVSVSPVEHLCKLRFVEVLKAILPSYRLPLPKEVEVQNGSVVRFSFERLLSPYEYALLRHITKAVYEMTAEAERLQCDYFPFAGP